MTLKPQDRRGFPALCLLPSAISGLYIWVVQPTGNIAFRKIDLQKTNINLENLVACARQEIGVEPRGETQEQSGSECPEQTGKLKWSRQLDQLLIEPIAALLPPNEQDKVIFIPHQQLFLVPFPALQDANARYLIEKHTILTAPSIQSLSTANGAELPMVGKLPPSGNRSRSPDRNLLPSRKLKQQYL